MKKILFFANILKLEYLILKCGHLTSLKNSEELATIGLLILCDTIPYRAES